MKIKPIEHDTVSCDKCGVILVKGYAQVVRDTDRNVDFFYCCQHKKQYEQISSVGCAPCFKKLFIVSEDGTPIGYIHDPKTNSQKKAD